MQTVELWCDGAGSGNGRESAAGGWAAVLISGRRGRGAGEDAATALWEELLVAAEPHRVEFTKVAGHSGVALNELVDGLAVRAVRAVRR